MVTKSRFTYLSRDGIHKCQAYKWQNDNVPVKGIFQIIHGMQEHMERYDEFASFMCDNGFIVVGNDHLGHGLTVSSEELGYFAKDNADVIVVRDVHRLKKMTEGEYPGLPYFILGHSMGSFIARKYLTMYGKGIRGAIICGTGTKPAIVTGFGKIVSSISGIFSKGHNKSGLIDRLSFGGYNKKIANPTGKNDWVVRNDDVLKKYNEDPLCGFPFTSNGFKTLFSILHYVDNPKNLVSIPKSLPIFVIAGMCDPVGNYGKGPKKVYDTYKHIGISDVSLKLYPDMRHEILNDIDRNIVYEDVLKWINSRI